MAGSYFPQAANGLHSDVLSGRQGPDSNDGHRPGHLVWNIGAISEEFRNQVALKSNS